MQPLKSKNISTFFIVGFIIYILGISAFTLFSYNQTKKSIFSKIDSNLKTGAFGAYYSLDKAFYENADFSTKLSNEADYANIIKLSEFAEKVGLKYVYTFIKKDNDIYFITSSATKEELNENSYTKFLDKYEDANDLEKEIFLSGKSIYEDSTDKWGSFRSILIPLKMKNGKVIVIGADVTTSYISAILREAITTSILSGVYFLGIILPFILAFIFWAKQNQTMLEAEVTARTLEITKINSSLEARIKAEIEKSRQNEVLLMKQSGLAAMGEMMGNIAHQWRQPINALGLIIQDLEDAYEYGELEQEYMKNSVKKSKDIISYMSQTINDFRNFFKPDKAREKFFPFSGVKTAISLLDGTLKANNIEVETFINDNVTIDGFPNEYSQVILNILNNAKDVFIERKIPHPKIIITLGKSLEDKSVVTIKDNGHGIPEPIINKIFEPYFTTKSQSKGTGLGLYMSKLIIEKNMNGSLTVSNDTDGAIFRIEV